MAGGGEHGERRRRYSAPRVGVYATNVLTEMYFRQVVGRFVRMQDKVPKPQRAWLYLPKDATLVHYAKRIKG